MSYLLCGTNEKKEIFDYTGLVVILINYNHSLILFRTTYSRFYKMYTQLPAVGRIVSKYEIKVNSYTAMVSYDETNHDNGH